MRYIDFPADRSGPPPTVANAAPLSCPSCRSTTITTTAKKPDDDSYWRCTRCGEIWNHSRRRQSR